MKLWSYAHSSAAFRVRIALNLKGLAPEVFPVHLTREGGQQHLPGFQALNPQELVPVLEDHGAVLTQSLAIIEYLNERYPDPPLLPFDSAERARVRALSAVIACDIHPLNNLRVRQYLEREAGLPAHAVSRWYGHWIETGFSALETMLARSPLTGHYCHGNSVTMADVFLVPQVFNARRFSIALDPYPVLKRIDEALRALPAFADAAPERQPDAG
ncbi:MAG: maleylacetoacetate isomerase [Alphaproteobacteria bacterium]|nr:maleylacetoacetate isomerase [Alphaproteobacteria bacterium]